MNQSLAPDLQLFKIVSNNIINLQVVVTLITCLSQEKLLASDLLFFVLGSKYTFYFLRHTHPCQIIMLQCVVINTKKCTET